MTGEAAPLTDKASTAPVPGASLPGALHPSQPRTFTQEATFGNLARLKRSTRLKMSRQASTVVIDGSARFTRDPIAARLTTTSEETLEP